MLNGNLTQGHPDYRRELESSRYPLGVYEDGLQEGLSPFCTPRESLIFDWAAGVGERRGRVSGRWPWSVYVRVLMPAGGWMSARLLDAVAALSERHGVGLVHFATGGTLEIYTTEAQVDALVESLHREGLEIGSTGEDLRYPVACAGPVRCDMALIPAPDLATYLGRRFWEEQQFPGLPHKCKVGVAGCPRDCVRASHRDMAFIGVPAPRPGGKPGVAVMLGGKYGQLTGRGAMPGRLLVPYLPLDFRTVGDVCARFLQVWCQEAENRERVGDFVARLGEEEVLARLRDALPSGPSLATEAAPATAGMPDYRLHLSPALRERCGLWVEHFSPQPGVLCHRAADGWECWTVRVLLPAVGMLSASTLRRLAELTRTYAQAARRTSRQGFELVGVEAQSLPSLRDEVARAGLVVGGSGVSVRQIKACTGYLHCQNALVDSPSLAQRLGEALHRSLDGVILPAPLRMAVSGCPNDCAGAQGADLGLIGRHLAGE
ncbi:MAG TPA: hypothetical protein GX513_07715, partial [Firmicutes bacterium]|nr:hypothetical protein [Bacillota bacterium]